MNVNIHNNYITDNSSTGDELFSATPAGAGAVSFCTGSDYYAFDYNWVCGNLSTGDGGGIGQLGFVYHHNDAHPMEGIRHNTISSTRAPTHRFRPMVAASWSWVRPTWIRPAVRPRPGLRT